MFYHRIRELADPINNSDAVNKIYLEQQLYSKVNTADVYNKTETYN